MQPELTQDQLYALIDLLVHEAIYQEIESFKDSQTIAEYGPPFQDISHSSAPILQGLLTEFGLTAPGANDIDPLFWTVRIKALISQFADANLSEAYDKGNLGIRKTSTTAGSSFLEYPVRALLGTFPKDEECFKREKYDLNDADDLEQAFKDFFQRLVHGNQLEKTYENSSTIEEFDQLDELDRATHRYILIHAASIMHHVLVSSPEGPTMVHMLENIHKMTPYAIIRQSLRISNVATMMKAMLRLTLAKVSIGSFTNWLGISKGANEGMNLLESIISTILARDCKDLKKLSDTIVNEKDHFSSELKAILDRYIELPKDEQLSIRRSSRESHKSIIQAIIIHFNENVILDDSAHQRALQYLSLNLSIRDRTEITRIICKGHPDHVSQGIRDLSSTYEPFIRKLHNVLDFPEWSSLGQSFLIDLLKLCKPQTSSPPPAVADFLVLLEKYGHLSHKVTYTVRIKAPEISALYKDCAGVAIAKFRKANTHSDNGTPISAALVVAYKGLSEQQRLQIQMEVESYRLHLDSLYASSKESIRNVLASYKQSKSVDSNPSQVDLQSDSATTQITSDEKGPGVFITRMQHLLDSTLITPDKLDGEIRTGKDDNVRCASRRDIEEKIADDTKQNVIDVEEKNKNAPNWPETPVTLKYMLPVLQKLIKEQGLVTK